MSEQESAPRELVLPREITDEISDVLGMPNFQTGPMAHVYRAAGFDIRPRFEDEQAFVLHRFLLLALEHGEEWPRFADEDLQSARAKARERRDALASGGAA